jgi:uncharacterized protein (DUF58 family)
MLHTRVRHLALLIVGVGTTVAFWIWGGEFGVAVILGVCLVMLLDFIWTLFFGAWQLSKDVQWLVSWIVCQVQQLKS